MTNQLDALPAGDFSRYLSAVRHQLIPEFCRDRLADVPRSVADEIVPEAERITEAEGAYPAYAAVLDAREALKAAHVHEAFDEDRLRACAKHYADRCREMPMLAERERFAIAAGIEPPAGKFLADNYEGRAKRLGDEKWWRRRLRAAWTRAAEGALRNLGMIRKGRQPYASDSAVNHRAAQREKGRRFLEGHQLVNEAGEQLDMLEIADRSLANPGLRRGELMCRVRGFEETAQDFGHVAEFVTLTTPSRFHAALAKGGRNPAYCRAAVREAQQWLCRMWARARAKLKRLQVLMYGIRVAEPHHDGTPHWHLLVFTRPNDADSLRDVLRGIWLSDSPGEAGAAEHRVKFERIDRAKGSAVGYVAKYVAKSIDGAGAIGAAADVETDTPVIDNVRRIDAWASLHGIRQFQQIGGPAIGIWREARRVREAVADPDIERARLAADAGDFAGFVQRVGGIHAGRHTNIRLEKAETGERSAYGECRPARTIGLRCASAVVLTRPHVWKIERKGQGGATKPGLVDRHPAQAERCSVSPSRSSSDLGPVAITVRNLPPPDDSYDWVATVPYIEKGKKWQRNRAPGSDPPQHCD